MTPEEKLYQGMFGVGGNAIPFLPTVPSNTVKLRMALLPALERTVQKNGITIDYITYFSETLRKWIIPSQYKRLNKSLQTNTVVCRRDPRDISKIFVLDPDINDYIEVPYSDIKRPSINVPELRRSIAEAKKRLQVAKSNNTIFLRHIAGFMNMPKNPKGSKKPSVVRKVLKSICERPLTMKRKC